MSDEHDYQAALQFALRAALLHLEQDQTAHLAPGASATTLRRQFPRALPAQGAPPDQVVAELTRMVKDGLVRSTSGRFFAWVIGGTLPAALAADWLTSAWDQNAAMHDCSPAAAVTEEVVGGWLKSLFGLPADAAYALVTGCQMAHLTCLAAARHALLARRAWDVERQGLAGAPRIRVLTSVERHTTIDRALKLLGIGTGNIVALPVDERGRLQPQALSRELAREPDAATLVVLLAGDLNQGAFDDFATLIPIARAHHAWVHVDGAFGLWAAASAEHRGLVEGVQLADSWATDGHKFLNVPYDCGYAFVRSVEDLRASLSYQASYVRGYDDVRNPADWNPEWSRRARAFPTCAALMQLGSQGIEALVDRCCAHARAVVTGIGALPGAEVVWTPTFNQGLVRFKSPKNRATAADHDQFTDAVIAAVRAGGEAFFGGVTWRGQRAMRVSVSNWRTDEHDVRRAIAAVGEALGALGHGTAARSA